MNKKIIAIATVTVGIVLVLISVLIVYGRKPTITTNEGNEYLAVTDDEGNTVLNKDGDIAVYVTDNNGKYVKDEDGERQTNYIDFPDKIISDNTFENLGFIFTMPKGWKLGDNGTFVKNGSDDTVTLECRSIEELEKSDTLDTIFEKAVEENNTFIDAIKDQNPGTNVEFSEKNFTVNSAEVRMLDYLVKIGPDNTFLHFNGTYFISGGQSYALLYISSDENFDDSVEDLITLISEGLTIKSR